MDMGVDIAFDICWCVSFSRWPTIEADSRNHGPPGRIRENMRGWSDGLILYSISHSIFVDSILALADFRGGFAELRTSMEEWNQYSRMELIMKRFMERFMTSH